MTLPGKPQAVWGLVFNGKRPKEYSATEMGWVLLQVEIYRFRTTERDCMAGEGESHKSTLSGKEKVTV